MAWSVNQQNSVMSALVSGGISPLGAAGLVSRWSNVEDPNGSGSTLGGYMDHALGIGQWLGSRKNALFDFADSTGGNPYDVLGTQTPFALHELTTGSDGTGGRALATLNSATTPFEAATGASMFERADGFSWSNGGTDNYTNKTAAGVPSILANWQASGGVPLGSETPFTGSSYDPNAEFANSLPNPSSGGMLGGIPVSSYSPPTALVNGQPATGEWVSVGGSNPNNDLSPITPMGNTGPDVSLGGVPQSSDNGGAPDASNAAVSQTYDDSENIDAAIYGQAGSQTSAGDYASAGQSVAQAGATKPVNTSKVSATAQTTPQAIDEQTKQLAANSQAENKTAQSNAEAAIKTQTGLVAGVETFFANIFVRGALIGVGIVLVLAAVFALAFDSGDVQAGAQRLGKVALLPK